jgi:hypothetical protein
VPEGAGWAPPPARQRPSWTIARSTVRSRSRQRQQSTSSSRRDAIGLPQPHTCLPRMVLSLRRARARSSGGGPARTARVRLRSQSPPGRSALEAAGDRERWHPREVTRMTVDVEVECIRLYRSEPEGDRFFTRSRSWWMIDYEGPDGEVLRTRRTTFPAHTDPYAVKDAVEGAAQPGIRIHSAGGTILAPSGSSRNVPDRPRDGRGGTGSVPDRPAGPGDPDRGAPTSIRPGTSTTDARSRGSRSDGERRASTKLLAPLLAVTLHRPQSGGAPLSALQTINTGTSPPRASSKSQGRYSPRSSWQTGVDDDQLKEDPGETSR